MRTPSSSTLVVVLSCLSACGPNGAQVSGSSGGGDASTSSSGGGSTSASGGGSTSSNGGGGGGGGSTQSTYAADSFYTQCNGVPTELAGVALAPNGLDPISGAEIAVYADTPTPLPRGVACESCGQTLGAAPLDSTTSAADGHFTLRLDRLKKQAAYTVTVRKARFRRVLTNLAITGCGSTVLTAAQTSLPRSSAQGDVPRIAVSSGNKDHLERVVNAMGITEYDCLKGMAASSSSETCTGGKTLGAVLADPAALNEYGLLFIACAPADTYAPRSPDAPEAKNLKAWVEAGGKLVVTDESYDFVEQLFPDAIEFAGTAAAQGVAQPFNTAEVGTFTSSVTGVVSDPSLAEWLKLFPGAITGAANVNLTGFLSKWAVQRGVGPGTGIIVHGLAPFGGGTNDVPLTSRFEVKGCGRVIFSSYHTDSGGTALLPQERILEYLMFEVAACTTLPS